MSTRRRRRELGTVPKDQTARKTNNKYRSTPLREKSVRNTRCDTPDKTKNMHFRGMERKAHMDAYGRESKEGRMGLINGRLEYMMETASKTAGLTEKQYREWRKAEKLEPLKRNGRGRSISKRRKRRDRTQGRTAREETAERQDLRRQQEEEKRRQKRNEEHLKEKGIQREKCGKRDRKTRRAERKKQ